MHTFTVFGILEVIKDVRKRRISDDETKIKVNEYIGGNGERGLIFS